jgi:hypothetical protein
VKTHTYYEDFQTIKSWLERKKYKVFYTLKSQKDYYEKIKTKKIKEIQKDKCLSQ